MWNLRDEYIDFANVMKNLAKKSAYSDTSSKRN